MKIYLPANIYTALLALHFPDDVKSNIEIIPSSMIAKKLMEDKDAVGLMPSCDLYKAEHVNVSNKIAISYDGVLSQSYLYFIPDQNKFEKILMRGDVSSNEVLLSKILFKERYDLQPVIVLDTNNLDFTENNYLISGQENNELVINNNGVSFADQIAEFIDFPYVNFVLASRNEGYISNITDAMKNIDKKIEDNILELLNNIALPIPLKNYIVENIDTIYFEMTRNEEEGLLELLKLPYFYGFVEELKEIKFV